MKRIVLTCLLSASACLGACADDPAPSTGVAQAPIRVANGARTSDLAYNALASGRAANRALAAVPLADASFGPGGHPDLRLPLHDPAAQVFMTYLVQCALDDHQWVSWKDPFDGRVHIFKGEIGLCPSWAGAPPTPECLEATSSCVLARNNGYGIHVEISLRGLVPDTGGALDYAEAPFYPIAEGAFFGTIFDAGVLPVDVVVDANGVVVGAPEPGQEPEVVFPRMYACSGPAWATAAAYTRHRVCAGARHEVSCLAHYAGPCDGDPGWRPVCATSYDKVGWGDCVGPDGQPWGHPLSVFLDSPGAVVDDQAVTALRGVKR